MKRLRILMVTTVIVLLFSLGIAGFTPARGQDSGWTVELSPLNEDSESSSYTGYLEHDGQPANGSFDLQVRLYPNSGGGTALNEVLTIEDIPVQDGAFSLVLDWEELGTAPWNAWIEVSLRAGDSRAGDPFTSLDRRLPADGAVAFPAEPEAPLLPDQAQPSTSEQLTADPLPLALGDITLRSPSPEPLTCVASDPSTGLVYAQQNYGYQFYVYDPLANAWSPLADAPINSENNGGAAYLDGKIYTIYTWVPTDMGVYDIASDTWSTMPNGLGEGSGVIASDGTYLYMAVYSVFKRYDPATDTWSDLATPSIDIQRWGGMAYWNGRLYAHRGNSYTDFARYDIASDTWTTLPSLPQGAVLGSAIDPLQRRYYAYGNYWLYPPDTNLYIFNLDAESWSTVTLPFGVNDGGMAYVSQGYVSGIYFVQGESGTGFARLETLPGPAGDFSAGLPSAVPLTCVTSDPTTGLVYAQQNNGTGFYVYDPLPGTWRTLTPAPISSGNNGGAAYLDGKIYTDYTSEFSLTDIGVYDIASNSWSTIPNGLGYGTGVIASDGTYLYMAVGTVPWNASMPRVFKRYDPVAVTWSDLATPSIDFEPWGGMAYWNGMLYAHRGNGHTEFARYDIASDTWTTLPSLPHGAVLGSAIDPVQRRYYAYGNYSWFSPPNTNLYIFDLDAESWSVETIPYFGVDDGGMAYAVRGHASGVFFVQGEIGTGFARYQDATPPGGGFAINGGAVFVNTTDVLLDVYAEDLESGVSHMRFRNESPWKALIFQDSFPWGSNALQRALEGNRLPYDQLTSAEMATTDLTPYSHVVIPSVQGATYFANFNSNLAAFEDYITGGGQMLMSFCTQNEIPPISIPLGGTNIRNSQSYNFIVDDDHPLFAGVLNPYWGSSASHNSLSDLLVGDEVLVTTGQTPGGEAVMIERSAGDGRLLAGGQTLEYAWMYPSWEGAKILENAIPYLAGGMPWSAATSWTLTPGDGLKTVYAQFRNGGSLWSEVLTDTIILETELPSSSATSPSYDNSGDIMVDWTASDAGPAGMAETTLWYRLDAGAWTASALSQAGTSGSFSFSPPGGINGTYYFATVASDNAGNLEAEPGGDGDSATIYDTQAPLAAASCIATTTSLSFQVSWSGSDALSGLASYDMQYREGAGGTWTDWPGLTGTTTTSATFGPDSPVAVVRNQTYYFRARAHDIAGNVGSYAEEGDCSTSVDALHIYLPMILGD